MCANAAAQGGYGGDVFTSVPGPNGTCGSGTAVNMYLPSETGYAKLTWTPAGFTLGNLPAINTSVAFTGDDQPFYMLEFYAPAINLGQTNPSDEILMIEFQNTTLSGPGNDTLALNPNTTLFNFYDNTTDTYLDPQTHTAESSGQQDAHTLAYWLSPSEDPALAGVALGQLRIGIGMAGGGATPLSATVGEVDITPEPASILLLLTVVGATGLGIRRRQKRNLVC